jgi:hypothetical protein
MPCGQGLQPGKRRLRIYLYNALQPGELHAITRLVELSS